MLVFFVLRARAYSGLFAFLLVLFAGRCDSRFVVVGLLLWLDAEIWGLLTEMGFLIFI